MSASSSLIPWWRRARTRRRTSWRVASSAMMAFELGLDDEKPSLDLLEAARHVAELPGHREVQVADGAAELLLDTLKIASRGKAREVVLGCQAPKGVSEV